MALLRLDAVRREIGTFVIVEDVSAAIAAGERIGLVGANGAGKTTLLRLAAGRDEPDRGTVLRRRDLTLGLLTQEANHDADFAGAATVRQAVRAGAADEEAMERELAALESEGTRGVSSARYADLRAWFEARDGYALDQRVEAALSGLGFGRDEWERAPTHLSGGQQTRAALARLLVADPELLLLDEPTNHLDVSALEWLEDHLSRRKGALLVASHDRAFLDAVVTRVWELRDRRLKAYRGDYSAYLLQREAADERQRKDAETRVEQVAREKELIQRYRSHRKYAKMHEHERRLEALQPLDGPRREARLALPSDSLLGGGPVRSGDLVVGIRDAVIGFPALRDRAPVPVAEVARLEARRGERIGIVGPNGVGKTTLLRTLAGELGPLDGTVRLGAAVQPGYLAQVRRRAFPGATVLDALLDEVNIDNGPARSYLARFLFRGEDVFKPVAELSGGERSRLELALLGITPANLLLLDEPTNHLDIPAREALESFLREVPGTIRVVSHDRRLLQTVCDRMWVAEPRDGAAAQFAAFEGGWREWRSAVADGWTVAGELDIQSRRLDGTRPAPDNARRGERREGAVAVAARPRTRVAPLSKDAYRRQKEAVETDLTRLGLRRNHLELALGRPDVQANFVELRRLTSELADVDAAIAQAEDAWLALEERAPR